MKQPVANIATVSIALVALFFSAGQLYLQREQNHIAVQPRLNAYPTNEQKLENLGLHIINNGLGPAFMESMDVIVDGVRIEGDGKFFQAAAKLGLVPGCLSISEPRPNDSLKTGEEISLIGVPKSAPALQCASTRLRLMSITSGRFDFTLTVKSIYGDRFSYNFKRNIQTPL
ncbi:hypothetical protein [Pseudomonas sp. B7]|uniref:hypothetical protein n=1 Tax=Pseudomonas sp. B7 TaxID=360962 RepID=UPI00191CD940|nr:hypothetical protein [Pseudomonas sp. B7]MBL0797821.1 hypothetical protein [Pseudomonas sp. B7]